MVRDVRYITLNSSYRDLQEMLLTGQLKTLALVESRGSCTAKKIYLKQVSRFNFIQMKQSFKMSGLELVLFELF